MESNENSLNGNTKAEEIVNKEIENEVEVSNDEKNKNELDNSKQEKAEENKDKNNSEDKKKLKEEKKALKKAKKEAKKLKKEEKRKNRSTAMKVFILGCKIVVAVALIISAFVGGYAMRSLNPMDIYPLSIFNNMENISEEVTTERPNFGVIRHEDEALVNATGKTELVKVEELPVEIQVEEPDTAGTIYMNATYTNKSNYVVKSYNLTVLLKDTNEKTYISFGDTVTPQSTSPKSKAFGPKSKNKADVEILKYEMVVLGPDGKDVNVTYDAKLSQYTVK